jgi:hypothetical protein
MGMALDGFDAFSGLTDGYWWSPAIIINDAWENRVVDQRDPGEPVEEPRLGEREFQLAAALQQEVVGWWGKPAMRRTPCAIQLIVRFGTDFTLLQDYFPHKTRKQIKKKYKHIFEHRQRKLNKI